MYTKYNPSVKTKKLPFVSFIPVRSQTVRVGWEQNAADLMPGQGLSASRQHPALGATDLGFVRSVLDLPDCSSVDSELVLEPI
jgi:hypothetical protein